MSPLRSGFCFVMALSTAVACGGAANSAGPSGTSGDAQPGSCSAVVTSSVAKQFPGSALSACKAERDHGNEQFAVKLIGQGGEHIEVDVAPNGTILQVEQMVPVDQVPAKVLAAFRAKYPGATPSSAEKQTRSGKPTTYELAFTTDSRAHESTFAEDGAFVGAE